MASPQRSASSEDSKQAPTLRIPNFRFAAQEDAVETLHQAYAKASHLPRLVQERSSEIVVLSGVSGTGKSTLVKHFLSELRSKTDAHNGKGTTTRGVKVYPHVLTGKYDEAKGGSRPLSGIIEAFSGFANTLELEDAGGWDLQKETSRLQEVIQDKLGEEANFLTTVIPELETLVGNSKEGSPSSTSTGEDASTSEEDEGNLADGSTWNRLRYVFQGFMAAISTVERPVILILDDLQWMDNASLELLQSLLCDKSLKHFMFIGLHRSEEVTPAHKLSIALDTIKKTTDMKSIELSNLDLAEMTGFLSKTLQTEAVGGSGSSIGENTRMESLTSAILHKTQGNIFFTLQILEDLQRKEVLQYSQSDSSWTWSQDPKQVIDLLHVDLRDILTEKIKSVSPLLQQILTIMSYTRSSLDIRTLRDIMQQTGWGVTVEQLVEELKVGEKADLLINKKGSPVYSFAHDSIQQAAFEFVPPGEQRTQYRVDMGLRLVNLYETHKRDWLLFAGADHLNATADQKTAESNFLFKINVQAGERAQTIAAFDSASDFLGRAVRIVEAQPNPWQTSYDSTLRLYRNLAATELWQGRMDAGKRLAAVVLDNANNTDDKVPTMTDMARALGVEQQHKESVNMCFRTLSLMKMYPKSGLGMNGLFVRDLAAVHRFWKEATTEQILQLPTLRDKRKVAALELLGYASFNSFFRGDNVTFLRTNLRSLRISFQHGLCRHSIGAISTFVVIRVNMGDFDGAKRAAVIARRVAKRFKFNSALSRQTISVTWFVSGWYEPQLKILSDFEQGYKAGMAGGDHEAAGLNGLGYCTFQYLSGYPLSSVAHRFARLIMELTERNVHTVLTMAQQTIFSVQVLQGKIPFDFESLASFGPRKKDKTNRTELSYGFIYRMMLGVSFGRYDLAEIMLAKLKRLSGQDKAVPAVSLSCLHAVLMYLSMYHDGGRKRNKSRAKPYIQTIESVHNALGTNSLHRLMLMRAHVNASEATSLAVVKKGYDDAIYQAIKTGHIQDAGLACQMAAQYMSSKIGAEKVNDAAASVRLNAAGEYLKKACKYYKRWGADGLVDHLQRQRDNGSMWASTNTHSRSSSRGRSEESDGEEWKHLKEPTLFDF